MNTLAKGKIVRVTIFLSEVPQFNAKIILAVTMLCSQFSPLPTSLLLLYIKCHNFQYDGVRHK